VNAAVWDISPRPAVELRQAKSPVGDGLAQCREPQRRAAMARTPVLREATLVRPLSAHAGRCRPSPKRLLRSRSGQRPDVLVGRKAVVAGAQFCPAATRARPELWRFASPYRGLEGMSGNGQGIVGTRATTERHMTARRGRMVANAVGVSSAPAPGISGRRTFVSRLAFCSPQIPASTSSGSGSLGPLPSVPKTVRRREHLDRRIAGDRVFRVDPEGQI
jgi:hypothetical protein